MPTQAPAVNGRVQCRDLTGEIAGHRLFSSLTPAACEAVAQASRSIRANAGTNLFEEGQPCKGLWLLRSGRVRLSHAGLDGRQWVTGFRSAGSMLEIASVLDGMHHLATATALEDVTAILVPRSVLEDAMQRNPGLASRAIAELCNEIRRRDIWTALRSLRDSRDRIGCALIHLAMEFGEVTDDGVRINYRLTRQDIADRAGVRLETAIRVVSAFQREDILETRDQLIEITDLPALRRTLSCNQCQFDCSVFGPRTHR